MGIDAGAIRELTEALDGKRPAQQPTVARARVVQSDGGGTWVQLDGGAARTPVASSTVAVRQGDEVMVRIDGGNAVITGNISRPSTDDSALKVLERAMDAFKRRVSDLNGNVSEIRQSADGIATRVENVEGSVASMENTAEGWSWVTSVKNQAAAANTAAEKAAADAANAQSSADEAAKTATDYMSFTSQGLIVGDMTEGVLTNNVLIDSDSVNIRNGDTSVASFGETSVIGDMSKEHLEITPVGIRSVYANLSDDVETESGSFENTNWSKTIVLEKYNTFQCTMVEMTDELAEPAVHYTVNGGAPVPVTLLWNKYHTYFGFHVVAPMSGTYTFSITGGNATGAYSVYTSTVTYEEGIRTDGNKLYTEQADITYLDSYGSITVLSNEVNRNVLIDAYGVEVSSAESDTSAFFTSRRTDVSPTRSISFGVGDSGARAGIWDPDANKWIIMRDGANTYLNGACVDVTSSSTASTFFTLDSTNVTSIESAYVARWGELCMVYVSVKMKVSLSAGDISNKVIGTLKSGYRPKIMAALTSGATGPVCAFYANTSGEVSVVATHSSVNAGKTISFGGTFILA